MKKRIILVALLLSGCSSDQAAEQMLKLAGHCDAASRPCLAQGTAGTLTVAVESPRAMQAFVINATWSGAPADAVVVSFEMVGMEMGENRYRLQPAGEGKWTGKAVLPLCIAGRSDWVAEVTVKDGHQVGHRARVPFTVAR
jgi:nitrogen fixation protein FixH